MKKKSLFILSGLGLFFGSCSIMQSAMKSTFPYTTTFEIPRSSPDNVVLSVTGTAKSFDENFNKDGNNADKIKDVRIVSAKVISDDPSDFNLGNFSMIKVYLSKADSTDEVPVASRTDITNLVGNSVVLDIDNSKILDKQVNQPKLRIRMEYRLRDHIYVNAHLKVVLGLRANP